jgi:hypothetical protein
VLSGRDVKDKAVNQVHLVVMGDGNCVVDNVPHRLISVDDSIFHIETFALFQVTFSAELNSLLIFGVYMSVPEKMIFLDFFITVTKYLETIRADVVSTQLAIQAVSN